MLAESDVDDVLACMTYGVKLHVWGASACFTRPELKAERVSYDVITPSAARGILEAIHWKPGMRWVVDRVHVLKPIRFETVCRNEVGRKVAVSKVSGAMRRRTTAGVQLLVEDERLYRATTLLRDVGYVIEAHFVLSDAAESSDTGAKHLAMFNRRVTRGQCFHRPYLGTRECAADFAPIDGAMPGSALPPPERDRDLGWMLYDIDHANARTPRFFRATLADGVIDVPAPHDPRVRG